MNIKLLLVVLITVVTVLLNALPADHDIVVPMQGSIMQESSLYRDFGDMKFYWNQDGKSHEKKVEGKHWKLNYVIHKDGAIASQMSEKQILGNYLQAAKQKGGKILVNATYEIAFTLERNNGGEIWVNVYSWGQGVYELNIIEPAILETDLIFGAEQIKNELETKGFIVLNGILFDTNNAFLKSKSIKALDEVTKMLRSNKGFKIEIQGHTDNIGEDSANLLLSEKRAKTVNDFLLLFGIEQDRLTARGLGETKPIADNSSEEGRKRNRRVELYKL